MTGAIVFSLLFGITEVLAAPANSSFDDQNFYNCVIDSYNKEKGTTNATTYNLSDTELGSLTKLDCYTSGKAENLKIVSTTGLEKMTGLTTLNLGENNISSIDVTKNIALTKLYVYTNNLTSIDISKNTALTILSLGKNKLTTLDVTKNIALTKLYVYTNNLTSIDISKNTALTFLSLVENNLTTLDVTSNTSLTTLWADVDTTLIGLKTSTTTTYYDVIKIENVCSNFTNKSFTYAIKNTSNKVIATDTVSCGETKRITAVDPSTTYTITETIPSGYTLDNNNQTITTGASGTAKVWKVTFTNTSTNTNTTNGIENPDTLVSFKIAIITIVVLLIGIILIIKNNKEKYY